MAQDPWGVGAGLAVSVWVNRYLKPSRTPASRPFFTSSLLVSCIFTSVFLCVLGSCPVSPSLFEVSTVVQTHYHQAKRSNIQSFYLLILRFLSIVSCPQDSAFDILNSTFLYLWLLKLFDSFQVEPRPSSTCTCLLNTISLLRIRDLCPLKTDPPSHLDYSTTTTHRNTLSSLVLDTNYIHM